MKIHGYCDGCHRIKRVTVGRFNPAIGGGIMSGICDDCETARTATPARGVVSSTTATTPEEDPNGSQHCD